MSAGRKSISIDKYDLTHIAKGATATTAPIQIGCYCGGSNVGIILFFPKGQVSNSYISESWFKLSFEIDRYQEIIETLRYEKPIIVYFSWDSNNNINMAYIGTNPEPIGEQEGV
jgi:hypothetical protein